MQKKAILLGSIGAMAETSDIQRRAYNQAMQENGLNWSWDRETYTRLLEQSGGKERLNLLALATGSDLSHDTIDTIHTRKTEIACEEIRSGPLALRPGVSALIRHAKKQGMKLGFVTSTYRLNVDALLDAAGDDLSASDLDVIVVRADIENGKPAPDAYEYALKHLGISADEALAIEDTANSVLAAKRAGIAVIATRGEYTADQDVALADLVLDALGGPDGVDQRVLDMLG